MDLFGKPVQDIYSTFLHLSGVINDTGSIVYDGRGNESIVTLSRNSCKINGTLTVNGIDFTLNDSSVFQLPPTSETILTLNTQTSAVEIRTVSEMFSRQQITYPLTPFTINALSANIDDIRNVREEFIYQTLDDIEEDYNLKLSSEVIFIQKIYYDDKLHDILYYPYTLTDVGWIDEPTI